MSGEHSDAEVARRDREIERLRLSNEAAEQRVKALEHQLAELEKRNTELDQFAYIASHDLRAPLRGITNLVTWIEEDLGAAMPRKVREHVSLLKSRAVRMDRLITGLLELARIGRMRLQLTSYSLLTRRSIC
jgi:light-regulated signal transduction histidine kinase (bacteriophytochrome)